MKKLLTTVLMTLFACNAFAATKADNDIAAAKKKLAQDFPQVQVSSVAKTPVDGLYEFVAGENVLYFHPESSHLIFGEIWNKAGVSLTQKTKDKIASAKLKDIPLDLAVKIGNGPKTVIEVTDPDCPYCRKGSAFLDTKENITRYIFFFPLKQIHPDAEKKAAFVLAAKNQEEAYKNVMSGAYDKNPVPFFIDNGVLEKHIEVATKLGVRGTPAYWIDGTAVSGANFGAIDKLLQQ